MSQDSFKVKKSLVTRPISRPTSPENGEIYYDSVQNKHFFYGNGSWTEIGAGVLNYISNPNAEASTSGWSTYADAAQPTPVNGTGGSANITLGRTTTNPLRGSGSFLLTKDAANRQGQGVSTDFSIDRADRAQILQISFDYELNSGTYEDGDIRVYLYDVTNSKLYEPSVRDLAANRPNSTYVGYVQPDAGSTSYRLILHVASTSALAYSIKYDNVQIGAAPVSLSESDIVAVKYSRSATASVSAGNNINFDTKIYDTHNAVTTGSSWVFKAPVSGLYQVMAVSQTNITVNFQLKIDGSVSEYIGAPAVAGAVFTTHTTVKLNAGQELALTVESTSDVNGNSPVLLSYICINQIKSSTPAISGSLVNAKYTSNSLGVSPGETILIFEDKVYDTNSAYNVANGKFVVPVSGKYNIAAVVTTNTLSLAVGQIIQTYVKVNGATQVYLAMAPIQSTTGNNYCLNGVATLDLSSGDEVEIAFFNSSGSGFALLADPTGNQVTFELISSLAQQNAVDRSHIRLQLGNGWGSTATNVRRFTNVIESYGSSIFYEDSAANGATFTIQAQGLYSISYTDNSTAGAVQVAITKNDTELTTSPFGMTNPSEILSACNSPGASVGGNVSVTVPLNIGDIIRAKGEGLASVGEACIETFTITRVN